MPHSQSGIEQPSARSASAIIRVAAILPRTFLIALPLILLLAAVSWRGYQAEAGLVRDQLLLEAEGALDAQARSIESQIMAVVRDAAFLSSTTSMLRMLDSGADRDRELLAAQFLNAVTRKGYDQVRCLDAAGREQVRVHQRLAVPAVAPEQELQDKSGSYYVKAGLSLARNEVYVSPLDLNLERGQVEQPPKPTFRVCTPVFDSQGAKRGLLVINVRAREMLDSLDAGPAQNTRRTMLLDSEGYWLKSPDPAEEWGFMFPDRQGLTFGARHPEAWKALRQGERTRAAAGEGLYASRTVRIASSGAEAGPGVWVFQGQLPGRSAPPELRLAALIPRDHVEQRLASLRHGALYPFSGAAAAILLFAAVLALALERRKADQQALQTLNARLEGVLDSATEVSIIATDPQGIITTFNRGAERLLGYSAGELVNAKTPAAFHLASEVLLRGRELSAEMGRPVEGFEVFVAKARDQGHETREWTYVRKDGEPRMVSLTITAIHDHRGELAGFLGVAQDITFEREAKARLQFQNLLMNAFSDASPDAIIVVDQMDRALYHNTRFLDMWGLRREELDNTPCSEILAKVLPQARDPRAFEKRIRELYQNPTEQDFSEIALADGRTLERSSVGLFSEGGAYLARAWFYRDVTTRVRAAEDLRRSESRFVDLANLAPVGIFETDAGGDCLFVNKQWRSLAGMTAEQAAGQGWALAIHPKDRKTVADEWYAAAAEGRDFRLEYRFQRPDGLTSWVIGTASSKRDQAGVLTGYFGSVLDITERKQAEIDLRQSQARLSAVLDTAVDGIVTIDPEGRILSVNPAVERIFGWTREEIKGGPVTRLMMEPYASQHDSYLARYLETGVPRIIGQGGREVPGRRKDGSLAPLELAVSEVRVGETRLFTGILRDITERKQAQERIIAANIELEARQQRLDQDLAAAGAIQKSLLPHKLPEVGGGLEIDWLFEPSQRIGGDIFNIFALDGERLAIYILDVSGHGAPSALVAVSVSQALQPGSGIVTRGSPGGPAQIASPAQVMQRLNREFPMERFDKFFSMAYLVLNHRTGQVDYCNAGHPPPLVVCADGTIERLEAGGMVVGMGDLARYEAGAVSLHNGDMLLLYTDGVTEYAEAAGELFGEERLESIAGRMAGRGPDEALDLLWGSLMRFGQGAEPGDDVSMVCIRRSGR